MLTRHSSREEAQAEGLVKDLALKAADGEDSLSGINDTT